MLRPPFALTGGGRRLWSSRTARRALCAVPGSIAPHSRGRYSPAADVSDDRINHYQPRSPRLDLALYLRKSSGIAQVDRLRVGQDQRTVRAHCVQARSEGVGETILDGEEES